MRDNDDGHGMGCTLTGCWQAWPQGPACFFHVGDSRLYRWRAGRLEQLSHDQTLYQRALDAGMQGALPARNLLLQAIGPAASILPEIQTLPIAEGDVLMLCSDGLHGPVPAADIAAVMAAATDDNLPDCCGRLVALAKHYQGRDNITVLMVRCHLS